MAEKEEERDVGAAEETEEPFPPCPSAPRGLGGRLFAADAARRVGEAKNDEEGATATCSVPPWVEVFDRAEIGEDNGELEEGDAR